MMADHERLAQALARLPVEDLYLLFRRALAEKGRTDDRGEALLAAERWLMARFGKSAGQLAESRKKIWLLFMLLRYAALRLREIRNLRPEDLDFRSGIVHVRGKFSRDVPLPLSASRRMAAAWLEGGYGERPDRNFYCDPSQTRRVFASCARNLGFGPELLSFRNLRLYRKNELERAGIPEELASFFLNGASGAPGRFSDPAKTLCKLVQTEEKVIRSSARNNFSGKITIIEPMGLLAKVALQTAEKMEITAIITETSVAALGLRPGGRATALIKAPMVEVLTDGAGAVTEYENHFRCLVEKISRDSFATEILGSAGEGASFCAIWLHRGKFCHDIREGASAWFCFSAYSVILTI